MSDANSVIAALARRHAPPEWAFFEQVGNATGFRCNRHADAVALGLWPSRGLDLHGFEVKVSRSDWLREKKRPAKADEIARHMDFWWIAVSGDGVCAPGDLPQTWGLMVLRGGKMVVERQAERMTPEPLGRPMLAAIMRRAADGTIPKSSVQDEIAKARKEGYDEGYRRYDMQHDADTTKRLLRSVEEYQKNIADFEEASGVKITTWSGGRIGQAVKLALALGKDGVLSRIKEVERDLERIQKDCQRAREEAHNG